MLLALPEAQGDQMSARRSFYPRVVARPTTKKETTIMSTIEQRSHIRYVYEKFSTAGDTMATSTLPLAERLMTAWQSIHVFDADDLPEEARADFRTIVEGLEIVPTLGDAGKAERLLRLVCDVRGAVADACARAG